MESGTISIITPTSDRPEGMALLRRWIERIDLRYAKRCHWIVSDDGEQPCTLFRNWAPPLSHTHVRRSSSCVNSIQSFRMNLLAALPHVAGEYVLIMEDDDAYRAHHVEDIVRRLEAGTVAAGDTCQRYFHVGQRRWKQFENVGSALCQTGFRVEMLPVFHEAIVHPEGEDGRGVDRAFWNRIMASGRRCDLFDGDKENAANVVGIKGLPGRRGIGIGHRPDETWNPDPDLAKLRGWIGDDAILYERFLEEKP